MSKSTSTFTVRNKHSAPIFSVLQCRCVGSSHLGPQTGQNVRRCVLVLQRAKGQTKGFEAGMSLWNPPPHTHTRGLGISGESGKNIPAIINQNFGDTNDQKQRSVLHYVTAMSHPPVPPHHRPSPDCTLNDWPAGP